MRYLIIAALLLAGCKIETNPKQEACLALGDGYRWADYHGYCYKFTGGKPKYGYKNELTMKDGCRVRTTTAMIRDTVVDPFTGKIEIEGGWRYFVQDHLNDWTDECTEAKDIYLESEVVKARYK